MTGSITLKQTTLAASGLTEPVQVPAGLTLVGVRTPEMTSTSFTISHSNSSAGAYATLKDPTGLITSAGDAVTFTMGDTSVGIWIIPPVVSALLNSWVKLDFSSNEAAGIELVFKDLA